MPQRTCRPMAMAIMLIGSTLSIDGLEREHGAIGRGAHEVGQVVDVGRVEAAADGHPGEDQRHVVDAAAHHALDGLEAA